MIGVLGCPMAGCYWTSNPGESIEIAAAMLVVHYRAKHEPLVERDDDMQPIHGTYIEHEQEERGGEA